MANYFDQFDEVGPAPKAAGNYFDQFDEPSPAARGAIDVAKQIGAGLVTGTEAIPAFPAQAAGFLGGLAEKVLPQSWLSPERAQEQAQIRELATQRRGEGIAQYLPKPETTAGQYARSAAEFIPAIAAGTRLALPRAVGVGATAGLTSEAAGQATEGTAAEPVARIGGALVGGTAALRQAERAAARAATPSIEQLRKQAGELYDQLRASGLEIKPAAAANYSQTMKSNLTAAGLSEDIAPKTWGILGKLENVPPGATMTAANFQSLRKTLGRAANSIDPQERLAAVQAKNELDDFLANLSRADVRRGNPQQASALLAEANANYGAAERAAAIDKRITAAETRASAAHSGMNVGNTIRQRMADILVNPALQRGYSQAELAQMRRIVEGTTAANTARFVGNALGGGGGLGLLAATGVTGGLGYAFADDPRYGAVPLAGLGLRSLGNRMTLAQAQRLATMARARSPLAAQTPGVAIGASPLALLPAGGRTLAEIGQELQ